MLDLEMNLMRTISAHSLMLENILRVISDTCSDSRITIQLLLILVRAFIAHTSTIIHYQYLWKWWCLLQFASFHYMHSNFEFQIFIDVAVVRNKSRQRIIPLSRGEEYYWWFGRYHFEWSSSILRMGIKGLLGSLQDATEAAAIGSFKGKSCRNTYSDVCRLIHA